MPSKPRSETISAFVAEYSTHAVGVKTCAAL